MPQRWCAYNKAATPVKRNGTDQRNLNTFTSTSVRMFEAGLDKMWNNQPMKFNYKEELCL